MVVSKKRGFIGKPSSALRDKKENTCITNSWGLMFCQLLIWDTLEVNSTSFHKSNKFLPHFPLWKIFPEMLRLQRQRQHWKMSPPASSGHHSYEKWCFVDLSVFCCRTASTFMSSQISLSDSGVTKPVFLETTLCPSEKTDCNIEPRAGRLHQLAYMLYLTQDVVPNHCTHAEVVWSTIVHKDWASTFIQGSLAWSLTAERKWLDNLHFTLKMWTGK